ncbi:hypothetical protein C8Q76DRAFT_628598, partial [Earliella scabrosa]
LPQNLSSWRRLPGSDQTFEPTEALWTSLSEFFAARGLTLWSHAFLSTLTAPQTDAASSGFMYSMPHREFGDQPGSVAAILEYSNTVRAYALLSMNHALPLLELIVLEDITFGVFPKAAWSVNFAYNFWAEASVGDILNILTQCLEALVFLHHVGIAHRDVFKDNFLAQWLPESLSLKHLAPAYPRVYLNDFEVAVYFPPDIPDAERRCVGPPVGGSFPDRYGRPTPPEVQCGSPYDPFKLDVWQLGTTFSDFKSTIPEIDAVLETMRDPDPKTRPTAYVAMKALLEVVGGIPPNILKIAPELTPLEGYASDPDSTSDEGSVPPSGPGSAP